MSRSGQRTTHKMYKNLKKIAILLATYNGEKHLEEQLNSLFRQSCQDFHLYIRDDGSTDNTMEILEQFTRKIPERITLIDDAQKHRGAALSFMYMLEQVESAYYMFCDQDDVWMDFKIEKTFARMQELEAANATSAETRTTVAVAADAVNKPLLVATDLEVVDENLQRIKESFNADLKIDVFKKHPNLICVRHVVTGCTMMFNEAAKKVSLPMSSLATMHDEWVALCVHFKGGSISILEEATIRYRQHSSNTLGASQASRSIWSRILASSGRKQFIQVAKLLHKEFNLSYLHFFLYKILYSWF